MTDDDLKRLEGKVDKLTDAVVHLARIDERQIAAARDMGDALVRIGVLEKAQDTTHETLHKWINRGVGAWALVGAGGTVIGLIAAFSKYTLTLH